MFGFRFLAATAATLMLTAGAQAQPITIASNPAGTDSNTVSSGMRNARKLVMP